MNILPPSVRHGAIALVVLLGLILGAWIGRESLLQGAADLWIVSDQLSPADAVVVLGGDHHFRPRAAADLYKKGMARKVLVSQTEDGGKIGLPAISSDSEINRAALLRLGVPADAIEKFGSANGNTRDEARALRNWAEQNESFSFVIPTEAFTARRVQWIVRREFSGVPLKLAILSIETQGYTRKEWWKSEQGLIAFQNEIVKYAYYRLKY